MSDRLSDEELADIANLPSMEFQRLDITHTDKTFVPLTPRQVEALTAELRERRAADQWQPADNLTPEYLPYERIDSEELTHAIHLRPGEHLLVLRPFGWHLDWEHIPNAAEHFSRAGVCRDHGWEVVCDYGPYIAVVRPAPPTQEPTR